MAVDFQTIKIIATLGPASAGEACLEALILEGVSGFRLNFSHNEPDWHRETAKLIRRLAEKHRRMVALLADLQGPKIRISTFREGRVAVRRGENFTIDLDTLPGEGDAERVGIDYPALVREVAPGDRLLIDDGRVSLEVQQCLDRSVRCTVLRSGVLSDHKGINKQGGGLSAPALTEKDKRDIKIAAEMDVDYFCVSFPKSASDLEEARRLVEETGSTARIISKLERAELLASTSTMVSVILSSDIVMIARGDLAVEIGDPALAMAQKRLMSCCKSLGRPVITATQMMESMVHSPVPTRAEVLDLSNAILDGTDLVMFSSETAVGEYPIETVQKAKEIIQGVEAAWTEFPQLRGRDPLKQSEQEVGRLKAIIPEVEERATLLAAASLALAPEEVALVVCTATAESALRLSSYAPVPTHCPIFAVSPHENALRQASLGRGVVPLPLFLGEKSRRLTLSELEQSVVEALLQREAVRHGDRILLLYGDDLFVSGRSNGCKFIQVGR